MFSAWSAMFAAPSATANSGYASASASPHAPSSSHMMPSQSLLGSYTSTPPHNLHSPYTSTGNNNAGPRSAHSNPNNNQRGGFRGGGGGGAQNRQQQNGNRNNKPHNSSSNFHSPNKNDDLNSNNKRPRSPGHSPPRKKDKKEKKDGGGSGIDGMPSLSSISLPADDPADIAAWIAERKKRFPTAAVVAAKQAAHDAAVARGEITDDKRKGNKGKGGKFQKGPRGNNQNPQQQQQQQQQPRGGGATRRGGHASSLYVLGRDTGSGEGGEERSDVDDDPSSEEEEDDAPAAGKSTAPAAMVPLSSDSPNWKRRLCQWEQPGMKGCRKPASQCSFLHRGEVPPPRHPSNAKVTHHSTILSNPAAPATGTPAGENNNSLSAAQESSIVAPNATADAEMGVVTEEPPSNPPTDASISSAAASTVANNTSTGSAAAVAPTTAQPASDAQVLSAPDSQPAPQPSHSISSLSAVAIDRLLQSIRFLVRNGPLRLKVEEPADSSEEDQ